MIQLTRDAAQHLITVRWDAPGTDTSYLLDDRTVMRSGQSIEDWRWLVDFRLHGDLSAANARYFFEVVVPDEARRLPQPLCIALVVSPGFAVIPASVPAAEVQQQGGFRVRTFTSEGPAMDWLLEA